MDVSFNNQVGELIAQLQLGQVIKVQVLEKTSSTHYLVSYRNIQFTAASEVDLFTKSVWLRLTAKHPIPKLQIIIEDNNSAMNYLLEHVEKSNLVLPSIPNQLYDLLSGYNGDIKPHEFINFIGLYTDMHYTGIFSDSLLIHLLNKGITFGNISVIYDYTLYIKAVKEESLELQIKLFSDTNDVNALTAAPKTIMRLTEMIQVVENINTLLINHGLQLALLYINHPSFISIIPVECTANNTMSGMLKTKHFGNISFKVQKKEIQFTFESGLYLKSIKALFNKFINDDIKIGFTVQNYPYMESKMYNDRSIVV